MDNDKQSLILEIDDKIEISKPIETKNKRILIIISTIVISILILVSISIGVYISLNKKDEMKLNTEEISNLTNTSTWIELNFAKTSSNCIYAQDNIETQDITLDECLISCYSNTSCFSIMYEDKCEFYGFGYFYTAECIDKNIQKDLYLKYTMVSDSAGDGIYLNQCAKQYTIVPNFEPDNDDDNNQQQNQEYDKELFDSLKANKTYYSCIEEDNIWCSHANIYDTLNSGDCLFNNENKKTVFFKVESLIQIKTTLEALRFLKDVEIIFVLYGSNMVWNESIVINNNQKVTLAGFDKNNKIIMNLQNTEFPQFIKAGDCNKKNLSTNKYIDINNCYIECYNNIDCYSFDYSVENNICNTYEYDSTVTDCSENNNYVRQLHIKPTGSFTLYNLDIQNGYILEQGAYMKFVNSEVDLKQLNSNRRFLNENTIVIFENSIYKLLIKTNLEWLNIFNNQISADTIKFSFVNYEEDVVIFNQQFVIPNEKHIIIEGNNTYFQYNETIINDRFFYVEGGELTIQNIIFQGSHLGQSTMSPTTAAPTTSMPTTSVPTISPTETESLKIQLYGRNRFINKFLSHEIIIYRNVSQVIFCLDDNNDGYCSNRAPCIWNNTILCQSTEDEMIKIPYFYNLTSITLPPDVILQMITVEVVNQTCNIIEIPRNDNLDINNNTNVFGQGELTFKNVNNILETSSNLPYARFIIKSKNHICDRTKLITNEPTISPSSSSVSPSALPSVSPTSLAPTLSPTIPTLSPTSFPSYTTINPTNFPTINDIPLDNSCFNLPGAPGKLPEFVGDYGLSIFDSLPIFNGDEILGNLGTPCEHILFGIKLAESKVDFTGLDYVKTCRILVLENFEVVQSFNGLTSLEYVEYVIIQAGLSKSFLGLENVLIGGLSIYFYLENTINQDLGLFNLDQGGNFGCNGCQKENFHGFEYLKAIGHLSLLYSDFLSFDGLNNLIVAKSITIKYPYIFGGGVGYNDFSALKSLVNVIEYIRIDVMSNTVELNLLHFCESFSSLKNVGGIFEIKSKSYRIESFEEFQTSCSSITNAPTTPTTTSPSFSPTKQPTKIPTYFHESSFSGGVLYNEGGTVNLHQNTFQDNLAYGFGGAIYSGGINSNIEISECEFISNRANKGYAIFNDIDSIMLINDCIFEDNHAIIEEFGESIGNYGNLFIDGALFLNEFRNIYDEFYINEIDNSKVYHESKSISSYNINENSKLLLNNLDIQGLNQNLIYRGNLEIFEGRRKFIETNCIEFSDLISRVQNVNLVKCKELCLSQYEFRLAVTASDLSCNGIKYHNNSGICEMYLDFKFNNCNTTNLDNFNFETGELLYQSYFIPDIYKQFIMLPQTIIEESQIIDSIKALSVYECKALCSYYSSCNFFVYNPFSNYEIFMNSFNVDQSKLISDCQLHNTIATSTDRYQSSGFTNYNGFVYGKYFGDSGFIKLPNVCPLLSSIELFSDIIVCEEDTCVASCQSNNDCYYASFDPKTSVCMLMRRIEITLDCEEQSGLTIYIDRNLIFSNQNFIFDSIHIYGNVYSADTNYRRRFRQHISYYYEQIGSSIINIEHAECEVRCKNIDECVGFLMIPKSLFGYWIGDGVECKLLKARDPSNYNTITLPSDVPYLTFYFKTSYNEYKFIGNETNVLNNGELKQFQDIYDIEECKLLCTMYAECKIFYFGSNNDCKILIRSKNVQQMKLFEFKEEEEEKEGFYIKTYASSLTSNQNYFVFNENLISYSYRGNGISASDYTITDVKSIDTCRARCEIDPECNGFTSYCTSNYTLRITNPTVPFNIKDIVITVSNGEIVNYNKMSISINPIIGYYPANETSAFNYDQISCEEVIDLLICHPKSLFFPETLTTLYFGSPEYLFDNDPSTEYLILDDFVNDPSINCCLYHYDSTMIEIIVNFTIPQEIEIVSLLINTNESDIFNFTNSNIELNNINLGSIKPGISEYDFSDTQIIDLIYDRDLIKCTCSIYNLISIDTKLESNSSQTLYLPIFNNYEESLNPLREYISLYGYKFLTSSSLETITNTPDASICAEKCNLLADNCKSFYYNIASKSCDLRLDREFKKSSDTMDVAYFKYQPASFAEKQLSCDFQNFNLNSVIDTITNIGLYQCKFLCKMVKDCIALKYDNLEQECILHSEEMPYHCDITNSTLYYTLKSTYYYTHVPGICSVNGEDNIIDTFNNINLEQCKELCSSIFDCQMIAYEYPFTCKLLYSAIYEINNSCNSIDYYISYESFSDSEIYDFVNIPNTCVCSDTFTCIDIYPAIDRSECIQRCNLLNDCNSFEFDGTSCKLSQSIYVSNQCNGVTSSFKYIQNVYSRVRNTCVDNYNVPNAYFKNKSLQECGALCKNNNECFGFEYGVDYNASEAYIELNACRLKSKELKEISEAEITNCQGEIKNVDYYIPLQALNYNRFEGKCLKEGNDLISDWLFKDLTIDQCMATCHALGECAGFEYTTNKNVQQSYNEYNCINSYKEFGFWLSYFSGGNSYYTISKEWTFDYNHLNWIADLYCTNNPETNQIFWRDEVALNDRCSAASQYFYMRNEYRNYYTQNKSPSKYNVKTKDFTSKANIGDCRLYKEMESTDCEDNEVDLYIAQEQFSNFQYVLNKNKCINTTLASTENLILDQNIELTLLLCKLRCTAYQTCESIYYNDDNNICIMFLPITNLQNLSYSDNNCNNYHNKLRLNKYKKITEFPETSELSEYITYYSKTQSICIALCSIDINCYVSRFIETNSQTNIGNCKLYKQLSYGNTTTGHIIVPDDEFLVKKLIRYRQVFDIENYYNYYFKQINDVTNKEVCALECKNNNCEIFTYWSEKQICKIGLTSDCGINCDGPIFYNYETTSYCEMKALKFIKELQENNLYGRSPSYPKYYLMISEGWDTMATNLVIDYENNYEGWTRKDLNHAALVLYSKIDKLELVINQKQQTLSIVQNQAKQINKQLKSMSYSMSGIRVTIDSTQEIFDAIKDAINVLKFIPRIGSIIKALRLPQLFSSLSKHLGRLSKTVETFSQQAIKATSSIDKLVKFLKSGPKVLLKSLPLWSNIATVLSSSYKCAKDDNNTQALQKIDSYMYQCSDTIQAEINILNIYSVIKNKLNNMKMSINTFKKKFNFFSYSIEKLYKNISVLQFIVKLVRFRLCIPWPRIRLWLPDVSFRDKCFSLRDIGNFLRDVERILRGIPFVGWVYGWITDTVDNILKRLFPPINIPIQGLDGIDANFFKNINIELVNLFEDTKFQLYLYPTSLIDQTLINANALTQFGAVVNLPQPGYVEFNDNIIEYFNKLIQESKRSIQNSIGIYEEYVELYNTISECSIPAEDDTPYYSDEEELETYNNTVNAIYPPISYQDCLINDFNTEIDLNIDEMLENAEQMYEDSLDTVNHTIDRIEDWFSGLDIAIDIQQAIECTSYRNFSFPTSEFKLNPFCGSFELPMTTKELCDDVNIDKEQLFSILKEKYGPVFNEIAESRRRRRRELTQRSSALKYELDIKLRFPESHLANFYLTIRIQCKCYLFNYK